MLTRRIWALMTALFSISSTPAVAQAPLQPIKPWNLDYGETQCVAARQYGNAHAPVTLLIRPAPNGETYELLVTRHVPGPRSPVEFEGAVDFGQGPIPAWLLSYQANTTRLAIHQFRIGAADMAQARTATAVALNAKGGADVRFALANMDQLLAGLEKCTADLKRYWNADGARISVPPKGSIREIFKPEDYPHQAALRDQQGSVQFQLLVDEKGSVAGCHVMRASGIPALDAMGCQVIRERAKFTPALDRTGQPVRSVYVTPPVRWSLED
jgi:TonB family protein